MKINLETKTKEQELILHYLEENASEVLADKINNGTPYTKDGKELINKKDFESFMKYACDEAKKLAEKGASYACIEDATVYQWAIHYFEEDTILGTLYNQDGTLYEEPKKEIPKATPKPVVKEEPKVKQLSLFDMIEQNFPPKDQQDVEEKADTSPKNEVIDFETGEVFETPNETDSTIATLNALFGGSQC
ncbi:MAG: hypothetical protein E7338_02025 [Clostridiales bacterium]|nr:hypothetical protein [Clostridiales bacterium]